MLGDLEAWYDANVDSTSPLLVAAMLHFAVTYIHPLADGNGRTARLLGNLELLRARYASILIEPEQRSDYFAVLERCSMRGDDGKGEVDEFAAFVAERERAALLRYFEVLEISHGIPLVESIAETLIDPR